MNVCFQCLIILNKSADCLKREPLAEPTPLPPLGGLGRPGRFTTSRRGFTLLELLAVISILVLMASVAGTAVYGVMASSQRVAAADQLVNWFEYGRTLAIVHGRASYVVFGDPSPTDASEYHAAGVYLEAEDPALPPVLVSAWGRMPRGISVAIRHQLPQTLSDPPDEMAFALPGGEPAVASGDGYVKFGPTGDVLTPSASALGGMRFALKGKAGVWAEVALSRFSGKVKVLPPS